MVKLRYYKIHENFVKAMKLTLCDIMVKSGYGYEDFLNKIYLISILKIHTFPNIGMLTSHQSANIHNVPF